MITITSLVSELSEFWETIKTFFITLWNQIEQFCLRFMSQDVFNLFVFALIGVIILFILLAIMNRK